jgi:hypothetical protein
MFNKDGEVDEQFIQANLCWLVTDNMEALLAKGKPIRCTGSTSEVFKFIEKSLKENKLVVISQDVNTAHDHHFAVIGMKGMIIVVEHLSDRCNAVEVYEPDQFSKLYSDIFMGKAPDTFYKRVSKKVISALAFDRKTMSAELVINYIRESKKPKKINLSFRGEPVSNYRATFEESVIEEPKIPKSLRKQYAEYIRLVEAYEGKKINPDDPVHIAIFLDPADREFTMTTLSQLVDGKHKVQPQLPVLAPAKKPKYSKDYLDFVALHENAYEHETDPDDEYFIKLYDDIVERNHHIAQAMDVIEFREGKKMREQKGKRPTKLKPINIKPKNEEDVFSLSYSDEPSSESSKKSTSTNTTSRGSGFKRRGLMFR